MGGPGKRIFYRSCNFCGGSRFRVFHRIDRRFPDRIYGDSELSDPRVGDVLDLQYLECVGCGLVGINPLPSFADIDRNRFDGERNLPAWADHDWDFYERDKLETIRNVYEAYDLESYRKTNRVLDVSCGPGVSLHWLRAEKEWEIHGVDPDRHSVRVAKQRYGVDVTNGLIADLGDPDGHYDLVLMDNSLEHTFDPMGTLIDTFRLLRPEGGLFIAVPNSHGLSTRALGMNAHWGHWFLFSPAVLAAMLSAIGFRVTRLFAVQRGERPDLEARGVDLEAHRAALEVSLVGDEEVKRVADTPAVSDYFHMLAERPAVDPDLGALARLRGIARQSTQERDRVQIEGEAGSGGSAATFTG